MSDKELINKLSAIVAKQQKIIIKLAQMMPATPVAEQQSATLVDVSLDLQAKLNAIPGGKTYKVETAELGTQSGALRAHIRVPMQDTHFIQVSAQLRKSVMGNALRANNGNVVQVTKDPSEITLTALKG